MLCHGHCPCRVVAQIYNENIRDLLRLPKAGSSSGSAAGAASSSSSAAAEPASLAIHQDADGHTDVPGLTRVAVSDASEIDTLLARAAKRRAVASTAMNEQSSRSHQVFTLYIKGAHAGKGIAVTGSLNLCDLAGSERLSRSGAEGDRKKEAAAINKSLSCLADVFTALAKKTSHVPFRNSKCVLRWRSPGGSCCGQGNCRAHTSHHLMRCPLPS